MRQFYANMAEPMKYFLPRGESFPPGLSAAPSRPTPSVSQPAYDPRTSPPNAKLQPVQMAIAEVRRQSAAWVLEQLDESSFQMLGSSGDPSFTLFVNVGYNVKDNGQVISCCGRSATVTFKNGVLGAICYSPGSNLDPLSVFIGGKFENVIPTHAGGDVMACYAPSEITGAQFSRAAQLRQAYFGNQDKEVADLKRRLEHPQTQKSGASSRKDDCQYYDYSAASRAGAIGGMYLGNGCH
jgi:hypothetical protein